MNSTIISRRLLLAAALAVLPLSGCALEAPEGSEGPTGEAQEAVVLGGYQVVSAETAVNTVSSKQLSVACPTGKKAMSAGWAVLDSTSAILDGVGTYSSPSWDGSSWLTNARSLAGATSWKLKVTVLCANTAALPGYEVTQVDSAVSSLSVKQVNVACSAGKSAVGAGWAVLDSGNGILDGEALYFAPSWNGASWLLNAQNNSTFAPTWKLRGIALCANTASLAGYSVVTQATAVNTTSLKQLNVACPGGQSATGAGWAVLDSGNGILNGSGRYFLPSFDGTSWLTNATNLSGFAPSWKLQVSAICVN